MFICKPLLVMLITTVPGDLHHSTYVASTRRPTAASKEDAIAPSFTMLSRISSLEIMPRGLLALDAACVALLVDSTERASPCSCVLPPQLLLEVTTYSQE